MERFAFKIDKALKANLYKICRLCGIDNPDKVSILSQIVDVDDGPEIAVKIQELIGIVITKNDKMPQEMCSICVDKINDFYEFREMCLATNVQTRKLLGLKNVEPKKEIADIKPEIIVKEELNYSGKRRGRKRKLEVDEEPFLIESGPLNKLRGTDVLSTRATSQRKRQQLLDIHTKLQELQVKPKVEIKQELDDDDVSSSKYKVKCPICVQRFCSKTKMDKHCSIVHVPSIWRYMCVACNETLKRAADIKNHQLWHKLTKTPYKCGYCDHTARTLYQYSRHLREHCFQMPNTVLDRVCPQCNESFATNYLYNIHECAAATLTCAGCNAVLETETIYRLHTAKCRRSYEMHSLHIPGAALKAECDVRIKNEADMDGLKDQALMMGGPMAMHDGQTTPLTNGSAGNTMVAIPFDHFSSNNSNSHKTSTKLKHNLKRVDDLLQSTFNTLASIKKEPQQQSVDQEGGAEGNVEIYENGEHDYNACDNGVGDRQPSTGTGNANGCLEVQLHIKEEPAESNENAAAAAADKMPAPMLKLKIKKEHGSLSSSLVEDNNGPVFSEQRSRKNHMQKPRGTHQHMNMLQHHGVVVKQERIDETDEEHNGASNTAQQHLQIASIAGGVEFGDKDYADGHGHDGFDVKPNKAELDRLLALSKKNTANAPSVAAADVPRIAAVQGGCDVNTFSGNYSGANVALPNVYIKSEPPDEHDHSNVGTSFDMSTIRIKTEPGIDLPQAQQFNNNQTFDNQPGEEISLPQPPPLPPVVEESNANSNLMTSKENSAQHCNQMEMENAIRNEENAQLNKPLEENVLEAENVEMPKDVADEAKEIKYDKQIENASQNEGDITNMAREICDSEKSVNDEDLVVASTSTSTTTITPPLPVHSVVVVETKEHVLQAQPFYDTASMASSSGSGLSNSNSELNATIEMTDEVVDNTLNQSTDEQQNDVLMLSTHSNSSLQLAGNNENTAPTTTTILQPVNTSNVEETENLHNERQVVQMQIQQQQLHVNDDDNVNEIAENNNNANIERELRDESILRGRSTSLNDIADFNNDDDNGDVL